MSNKKRKSFTLTPKICKKLDEFAKQDNAKSTSAFLEKVLEKVLVVDFDKPVDEKLKDFEKESIEQAENEIKSDDFKAPDFWQDKVDNNNLGKLKTELTQLINKRDNVLTQVASGDKEVEELDEFDQEIGKQKKKIQTLNEKIGKWKELKSSSQRILDKVEHRKNEILYKKIRESFNDYLSYVEVTLAQFENSINTLEKMHNQAGGIAVHVDKNRPNLNLINVLRRLNKNTGNALDIDVMPSRRVDPQKPFDELFELRSFEDLGDKI